MTIRKNDCEKLQGAHQFIVIGAAMLHINITIFDLHWMVMNHLCIYVIFTSTDEVNM